MSAAQTHEDRPDLAGFRGDGGGVTLDIPETMNANPEPEDEAPQNPKRPLSAREQIMLRAVERANEVREQELAQAAIYDTEAREAGLTFPTDEEPSAPVQAQEPRREAITQAPEPVQLAPAPVHAAPQIRTVMLDGMQYQVTEQQFEQLANLGMVTTKALHYQEPPAPQPALQPMATPQRPMVDPDAVREAVKKIQYGGEDEGAEALTNLITNVISHVPQAPRIDPNQLVAQAVGEAEARARLRMESDIIRQEYADIFANPQREFLAQVNVEAIRRRNAAIGQRQPDLEIYREAGNMVRTAMGTPAPSAVIPEPRQEAAPAQQPTQNRADVLERKRNAPRPTQQVDMRAPTPQATRAPTGSEIVNRMRVARGVPGDLGLRNG